jgi:hypothetical protein
MKSMNTEEKKFRAVSYSPKNNPHNIRKSNFSKDKFDKIDKNDKISSKQNSAEKSTTSLKKFSNNNVANNTKNSALLIKSPSTQKPSSLMNSLDRITISKKLPRLTTDNTMTITSNRDKNFDSTHVTEVSSNAYNNQIFNTLYSKLNEYKSNNKQINSNKFIEYLVEIFENISHNLDKKYIKISEILNNLAHINNGNSNTSSMNNLLIPSPSTTTNSLEIIENLKKEILNKETQYKIIFEKLNESERIIREKENFINTLNKKYKTLKQNFTSMKEENRTMKSSNKDLTAEIQFLREKEWKMMEVMYMLQKKGISIDNIMKENSMCIEDMTINDNSNNNSECNINKSQLNEHDNFNDYSTTTVYFPDKINIPIGSTNILNVNIPKLDFGGLPEYESENEDKDKDKDKDKKVDPIKIEKNKNEEVSEVNLYTNESINLNSNSNNKNKNKIKDFNGEFYGHIEEYSESWRKEIKQMKPLKESLKNMNLNSNMGNSKIKKQKK